MHPFPAGYAIRPLSPQDAPELTDAFQRNRGHLAPTSPLHSEFFFTLEGQQAELRRQLEVIEAGRMAAYVVELADRIVARVNLNSIVRGAFHSTNLGYWVDQDEQNKGLATAAVDFACARAGELGLHRVEAGTLVHNEASQRVLRKCGFTMFGTAPRYLFIGGSWRDHVLFQRILNDDPLDLR